MHQKQLAQYTVQELYRLGFSMPSIAELTHTNTRNIRTHLTRLGGARAFPGRPRKSSVYAAAFVRYATLVENMEGKSNNTHREQEAIVCEYLARFLGVERILTYARGSEAAMLQLRQYGDPSRRHVRQLLAIIGKQGAFIPIKNDIWWQTGWIFYILDGGAPASMEEVQRRLAQHVASEGQKWIRPCWDNIPTDFLDEAFLKLTPIENCIVKCVADAETLDAAFKEMGERYCLPRERIRKLYHQARRKLEQSLHHKGYSAVLHLTCQDFLEHAINAIREAKPPS